MGQRLASSNSSAGRAAQLLCLGAHSDDIEIGCGGTILRIAAELPNLVVTWIVFFDEVRRVPPKV